MATIKDIARMAGVSTATVSHVINQTRYVSPELKEKVEQAILAADTPPKFVIRRQKKMGEAVRKSGRGVIIYICHDEANAFCAGVSRQLKQVLEEKGYSFAVLTCNSEAQAEVCMNVLKYTKSVSGIFVSVKDYSAGIQSIIHSVQVPCVVIGNELDDSAFDRVTSSNYKGAYDCTIHLIRNGHEKIAVLIGDLSVQSNKERLSGYEAALRESGLKVRQPYILQKAGGFSSVTDQLGRLLEEKDAPTAIFAGSSEFVYTLYRYMMKRNIQCPKELSVIGFTNMESAPLLNPPLTAVSQDLVCIARRAIELLENKIKSFMYGQKLDLIFNKPVMVTVDTKLEIRDSTIGIARGPFGEKGADMKSLMLTSEDADRCRVKGYTAVIVYHYMGRSLMKLHEQGVKDIFDRFGITVIAVMGCRLDYSMQMKQIQSVLMLEPDIMIAFPVDHTLTGDVFAQVTKTKTKLVFMGHVPDGFMNRGYVSCVNVNERSNGRNIGRGLGNYMRANGKKNIAILRYGTHFYTTNQRDAAVEQILQEEYPEMEICAVENFYSEEDAYNKTVALLEMRPDIEGLYVSWEGPAENAIRALNDKQRRDIAVVTSDLEYSVALDMAKGGCVKALSVQRPFEEGQAAALCGVNAVLGKNVPSFIAIEPIFVTSENLIKAWSLVYMKKAPQEIVEALEANEQFKKE